MTDGATVGSERAGRQRTDPIGPLTEPPPRDLRTVGSRIEELLGRIRAGDPGTADTAEEVVRLVVELYGAGLERTVELAGPEVLERLVEDELVASLLVLHGLHPKDTETRVVEALDQVRPYLGSHAGGVELLGVDPEGVVRLRLEGSCDGCPSSTQTVKLAIERAIEEAAPEVTAVEVENLTREKEPQLLQIQPLAPREWEVVDGLDGLEPGRLTTVEVAGSSVVVCSVGGQLYAYRDRCPACGTGLAGRAELQAEVLACGSCRQRFDVRLAGRGVDRPELHLVPLPLLAGDGRVRLAVGSGAGA
jgi:Fe-S cluster biogenesis protein NfuA/nitrite reductase/ring-hydroxylating ferredoxin subunit